MASGSATFPWVGGRFKGRKRYMRDLVRSSRARKRALKKAWRLRHLAGL